MAVPESLARKIDLFGSRGHFVAYAEESFDEASWVTMYAGFGRLPLRHDARVDKLDIQSTGARAGDDRARPSARRRKWRPATRNSSRATAPQARENKLAEDTFPLLPACDALQEERYPR